MSVDSFKDGTMRQITLVALFALCLTACENGGSDVATEKSVDDPNLAPPTVSLPDPPPASDSGSESEYRSSCSSDSPPADSLSE